jgi:hypothetical protein
LAIRPSPGFPDRSTKNLAGNPEEGEKERKKEIGHTKPSRFITQTVLAEN